AQAVPLQAAVHGMDLRASRGGARNVDPSLDTTKSSRGGNRLGTVSPLVADLQLVQALHAGPFHPARSRPGTPGASVRPSAREPRVPSRREPLAREPACPGLCGFSSGSILARVRARASAHRPVAGG